MASYKDDLGLAILACARTVPDGLLVFFPSYSLMDSYLAHWKAVRSPTAGGGAARSIYEQIGQAKPIVIEPKAKGDLKQAMGAYDAHIDFAAATTRRGALFFAVCRGKVSEGLDFADAKGRAVIVTGIPYPPLKDPKVVLKRQYLQDSQQASAARQPALALPSKRPAAAPCAALSGDEWYSQQAARAVNQAIGRVIRHVKDYGAIILFDDRFAQARTLTSLSRWLRPYVRVADTFPTFVGDMSAFFEAKHDAACQVRGPSPRRTCHPGSPWAVPTNARVRTSRSKLARQPKASRGEHSREARRMPFARLAGRKSPSRQREPFSLPPQRRPMRPYPTAQGRRGPMATPLCRCLRCRLQKPRTALGHTSSR